MKQCTKCKCQVGSGVIICPYCNAYLPEPKEPLRPVRAQSTPVVLLQRPNRTLSVQQPVIHEIYEPALPQNDTLLAPQVTNVPERSMSFLLLTTMVCLAVANVLELAALLMILR